MKEWDWEFAHFLSEQLGFADNYHNDNKMNYDDMTIWRLKRVMKILGYMNGLNLYNTTNRLVLLSLRIVIY